MAKKQNQPTPDMTEVGFRCEPWLAEMVYGAASSTGRSVKGYLRHAATKLLRKLGIQVDPDPRVYPKMPLDRMHMEVPVWFRDLLKHGSRKNGGRSIAEFMRQAILECALEDGFQPPDDATEVNPRGRPKLTE